MVLVTVVLAMLLVAAVPNFTGTAARLQTEQTAFALAQLFRYAHERAVTQGEPIAWVWDPDARQARLEIDPIEGEPLPLEERGTHRRVASEAIDVALTRDEVPVERVTFFPDGTSEAATLVVSHRGRAYTVTVHATTSRVTLTDGSGS